MHRYMFRCVTLTAHLATLANALWISTENVHGHSIQNKCLSV